MENTRVDYLLELMEEVKKAKEELQRSNEKLEKAKEELHNLEQTRKKQSI